MTVPGKSHPGEEEIRSYEFRLVKQIGFALSFESGKIAEKERELKGNHG